MPGAEAAPTEYVTLFLCRNVFHCLPSELRRERFSDIQEALLCLKIEAEVREAKTGKNNLAGNFLNGNNG